MLGFAPPMTTSITLDSLSKHIGSVRAVDDVTLTIEPGELFFLLGPSGCGKTTMLRLIAGFIEPTAGRVRFGDRDVTRLAPNKRNAGMVFQSYALWPHMTVLQNVAFGLGARKVPRPERRARAMEALESVQMTSCADRKPSQLSGGQQQRVALARALAVEPQVLLLDEPLSNLDAKLRLEMRSEIRRLCKRAGITTVYVTHDQAEALSMADRLAVMQAGRIVQVDAPTEAYRKPRNQFVAEFLGETNFAPGQVVGMTETEIEIDTPAGRLIAARNGNVLSDVQSVVCSIRPESIRIADSPGAANTLQGDNLETMYLGSVAQHRIRIGELEFKLNEPNPDPAFSPAGKSLQVSVNKEDIVVLPNET